MRRLKGRWASLSMQQRIILGGILIIIVAAWFLYAGPLLGAWDYCRVFRANLGWEADSYDMTCEQYAFDIMSEQGGLLRECYRQTLFTGKLPACYLAAGFAE